MSSSSSHLSLRLLIDGYNLAHAIGLLGQRRGAGVLERARDRLIESVADRLLPDEVNQTVIVFDARDVPRDRPSRLHRRGITLLFSVEHVDADELLVELVRQVTAPKNLLVVSSDHRVQVAAQRRKAQTIDSDRWWYDRPPTQSHESQAAASDPPSAATRESSTTLNADEVEHWLKAFGMHPDDKK